MKKIKRLIKGKSKKDYGNQVDDLEHLEGPLGIDDSRKSSGTTPLTAAPRLQFRAAEPVIFSGTPDDGARVSEVHISVDGSSAAHFAPPAIESTSQLAPRSDEIEEIESDNESLAEVSLADTEHPVMMEGGVRIHTVKQSDTVSGICIAYNVTMDGLLKLNKATRTSLLARKTIKIPPCA